MNNLASYIDHTELRPEQPLGRYTDLVRESIKYHFASVCVNSAFVPLVYNILSNHPENNIKVCSVVGFPFGSASLEAKLAEVNQILIDGCHELDLVAPIYSIKTGDWDHVRKEIKAVRDEAPNHILKVILEVGLLTDEEVIKATEICVSLSCDFVKTSTGFNVKLTPQETARYVKLMADCVKETSTQVKASGGIRTLADVKLMISSGATRIGSSNSVNIMKELELENATQRILPL